MSKLIRITPISKMHLKAHLSMTNRGKSYFTISGKEVRHLVRYGPEAYLSRTIIKHKGRVQYDLCVHKVIGFVRSEGMHDKATSCMSIIVAPDGELITAYPSLEGICTKCRRDMQ